MSRESIQDLLARSSLGCPNTPRCGHLLTEHTVDDWDGNGDPINPVCPPSAIMAWDGAGNRIYPPRDASDA